MGRSYSLVQGNFKGACYPLIPAKPPQKNNGLKAVQCSFSSPTHFISRLLPALICARPTIGSALKRVLIPALGIPGDLPATGQITPTLGQPARKWLAQPGLSVRAKPSGAGWPRDAQRLAARDPEDPHPHPPSRGRVLFPENSLPPLWSA